ncbi:MAG: hydroxymyristoyl-ACP dehydratase [Clostridiales bacterium]|jgi:hypothetical protein|nr:hydroxymyristoyl-ACP dehydratase [Clostridiales bacterium]
MDINCTNKCVYQTDGKCTLNELQSLTSSAAVMYSTDTDCPYCVQKTSVN